MRFSSFLMIGLISLSLSGQIILKPLSAESQNEVQSLNGTPTSLPFWDDFSSNSILPGDQWEFSESTRVSLGSALNPPSMGAITLDGIDSTGNVYDASNNFPGLTDQLISKRIDLSPLINDESIYLSFYWEAGGNVQRPEDPGDSLRLQLLNSDSLWVTVWKSHAIDVSEYDQFQQEILQIESNYRHDDFRFKFEAFGSQTGPFDAWHLDYIYLNNGRSVSDIFYFDRTMSGQLSPMTAPYRELPAEHFFADPSRYLVNQELVVGNLRNTPHTAILQYSLTNTNTAEEFTFTDASNTLGISEVLPVELDFMPNLVSLDPLPDSIFFEVEVNSNFNDPETPVDFGVNDTLRDTYLFHDYYAYDDGTAEFAAGVAQNGSVGIEFVIAQLDSMTHVDLFFPSITPTAAGKTIEVKVWEHLDSLEVETKTLIVPDSLLNTFIRVKLNNPVRVEDTIYVGYKQRSTDFIGIGLDRSNMDVTDKMFYLRDGQWENTENAQGIMMIRPVFSKLEPLPLSTPKNAVNTLYPNPNDGLLYVTGEYSELRIWNMSGQLVFKESRSVHHNLTSLQGGLYIAEVVGTKESEVFKLRIR